MSDLNHWIAQELIETPDQWLPEDTSFKLKPHNMVLGLYHAFDKLSGILVRVNNSKRVINMSHGTKIGWAFPCTINERNKLINLVASCSSELA